MDRRERQNLSARIKEEAQRLGFEIVGISPVRPPRHEQSFASWLRNELHGELAYMERTEALRRDPKNLVPWAESLVSVAMNYFKPLPRPGSAPGNRAPASESAALTAGFKPGPTNTRSSDLPGPKGWISRYAWGDDYHDVMKGNLDALVQAIRSFYDQPFEARAFVDSGPVLERDFAATAGIGWIGKNTHLISPKKGSWFFLGELFLSIPLAYDRPIRDRCGRCDLCLKACPTGAFVGPYVLDARRCISYLTIELKGFIPRRLRPLVGDHVFGCDICQEVCPYNVKAKPTREASFEPRPGLYAPELISLLSMSDDEFRERFRGSPILRARRRGFLRNIAVALGNSRDPRAIPALIDALEDAEPLVRGHAAWALGRIGTDPAVRALRARLDKESDPEVKQEIDGAIQEAESRPELDNRE
jgi:epoxyqueuosine reductase